MYVKTICLNIHDHLFQAVYVYNRTTVFKGFYLYDSWNCYIEV